MEHHLYDKTLKELFSRPEIVRDFLKGFVDSNFINDIDFTRIEKKNTSYIAKTFKNKYTDLALKLNMTGGKCAYLYLVIEFQSTVDKLMPLRILSTATGKLVSISQVCPCPGSYAKSMILLQ